MKKFIELSADRIAVITWSERHDLQAKEKKECSDLYCKQLDGPLTPEEDARYQELLNMPYETVASNFQVDIVDPQPVPRDYVTNSFRISSLELGLISTAIDDVKACYVGKTTPKSEVDY